ncbi:anaphase-promoting complex subunit Cut9 [Coemansia sp. Cherry 401B]|nr:anaphase-promoting complex subunit Cut9 [Coemansia sp. RSA 2705]KAJ2738919.1 anaphase-promoting complex subunit Cut9 [Coemansia sp. Cherry 401B]
MSTAEVVAQLRGLRASCAQGMAWSSALIWGEKTLLLSGDIEDMLWLVDALVTNGQYRQAEELLVSHRYAASVRASSKGRYLASVVAMRLGRAEDALELLSIDEGQMSGTGNEAMGGGLPGMDIPLTPTTKRPGGGSGPAALPLLSSAADDSCDSSTHTQSSSSVTGADSQGPPLNPRAWMLYMQGAAVVQLSNVGASEATPSIKQLRAQHSHSEARPFSSFNPTEAGDQSAVRGHDAGLAARLGGMDALVARIWTAAARADARCWEAWSGLRDYGLLTSNEETELIGSIDWTLACGGSATAGRFFRDYCLATQTSHATGDAAIEATRKLLTAYPQLIHDPALRTIQAARLLSLGRARECLEYTVSVLERRRVPDSSATAIHITALTMLHANDALFRIAHELAEEFGLSAIKRAEIEPSDTTALVDGAAGRLAGGSMSTPRGSAIGAAVAGTARLRTGARGLMVPETPSKTAPGSTFGNNQVAGSTHRQGAAHAIARSVVQTASAAATAVWRGLWGLPTWTHPGPPVLATYPSALGPAQSPFVSADVATSTLSTYTTSNAQATGALTQYEFVGASLAWYAIGSYYLVSVAVMAAPNIAQREWAQTSGLMGSGNLQQRRSQPLAPEAEHALAEARRWLAKATLAAPRSVAAWVAFAHTFVVAGEWESATRALHTAVGLCGCEGVVHGGGRDNKDAQQTPSKPGAAVESRDLLATGARSAERGAERGSRLAHVPLASLGSVYLQMGDLGMAESCLDASARCLSGFRLRAWLAAWRPHLDAVKNDCILAWASGKHPIDDPVCLASLSDPQLLNDAGVLFYSLGELSMARSLFALALQSLSANNCRQHALYAAFNPSTPHSRGAGPEIQALTALVTANLGNTLRRQGDCTAALVCLQQAAEQAPLDIDIALSKAFTLHSRAVASYPDPEWSGDLDAAIDAYHRVLTDRVGDPAATDLLTLALELSAFGMDDPLGLGNQQEDDEDGLYALRSLDDIGLLSLDPPLSEQEEIESQPATDIADSTDEDSDEAMDIEDSD